MNLKKVPSINKVTRFVSGRFLPKFYNKSIFSGTQKYKKYAWRHQLTSLNHSIFRLWSFLGVTLQKSVKFCPNRISLLISRTWHFLMPSPEAFDSCDSSNVGFGGRSVGPSTNWTGKINRISYGSVKET